MNEIRLPNVSPVPVAHVHRHHRLEPHGRLAPLLEEAAHPAGRRGQHHVVQRRSEAALDREQVVERPVHEREVAVAGDRVVEDLRDRRGRCRVRRGPRGASRPACGAGDPLRGAERPGREGNELELVPHQVGDGIAEAVKRPRDGPGPPIVRLGRVGVGGRVEQQRGELHRRDAVHHAVVGLADNGQAAVLQAVRDPQLPQRPAALERLGHHGVDRVSEPSGGRSPDVPRQVEVGVVHPLRGVQAEWHGRKLLPVAGRAAQAASDVVAKRLEAGRHSAGGGFEQGRPTDVHVGGRALDVQKRSVER